MNIKILLIALMVLAANANSIKKIKDSPNTLGVAGILDVIGTASEEDEILQDLVDKSVQLMELGDEIDLDMEKVLLVTEWLNKLKNQWELLKTFWQTKIEEFIVSQAMDQYKNETETTTTEDPCAYDCYENDLPCCDDSGRCVSSSWFCDGYSDCPNGYDELNC